MSWIYLILAGIFEMVGVVKINKWHQDRNWQTLVWLQVFFGLSFLFLALSLQSLPMGIAYAIWTGIGASGGAVLGMLLFGESKDWRRVLFISMILMAVIGLKLIS